MSLHSTIFWHVYLQYLANAVARLDNLEFLVDIVPRTVPYKQVKEKKAPTGPLVTNGETSVETGQTTLDGKGTVLNGTNGFGHDGTRESVEGAGSGDPNSQLQMENRGNGSSVPVGVNGVHTSQDVEMTDDGS